MNTGCANECITTWHERHGAALPGGPFPGTHGHPGALRRCPHNRVWTHNGIYTSRYGTLHDTWRPINRWLEPFTYRRALAHLNKETHP